MEHSRIRVNAHWRRLENVSTFLTEVVLLACLLGVLLTTLYCVCIFTELLIASFFKLVMLSASVTLSACYYLVAAACHFVYHLCCTNSPWMFQFAFPPFDARVEDIHRLLLVGNFTSPLGVVSYLAPISDYIGSLIWCLIEYLLDVRLLLRSLPAVSFAALIYGLVFLIVPLAQIRQSHRTPSTDLFARDRDKLRVPPSSFNKLFGSLKQEKYSIHVQVKKKQPSRQMYMKLKMKKLKQQTLCVVCLDRQRNTVLKPCQHLCACSECASMLSRCPVCRQQVSIQEKVYIA